LNNLAIVIEASGDLDGAESLYTKVIGLWAELKGSDHPNVTRTLGNLADLNHRRGQLDDALEAYKLAVATIDQNNTVEANEVKRAIYVSYAKLLRELGRNTEADRVLQKVFQKPK
jgi:tetratricopeptide (TPR) repeat protein